jgi:hypothetical protein
MSEERKESIFDQNNLGLTLEDVPLYFLNTAADISISMGYIHVLHELRKTSKGAAI